MVVTHFTAVVSAGTPQIPCLRRGSPVEATFSVSEPLLYVEKCLAPTEGIQIRGVTYCR